MASPLINSTGAAGDGFLPATGFGPGSIVIALIGGALTLFGAMMRRFGRRPTPAAS
jgi:hypothetical protein